MRAANGLMAQVLEGHIREHLGAEDAPAAQRNSKRPVSTV